MFILVVVAVWKGLPLVKSVLAKLEDMQDRDTDVTPGVGAGQARPKAAEVELVPCRHCGAYIGRGDVCDCRR
ncbi:hypothetical protein [Marinivivus vitaminiproducens]|uniref:hypothetical protein n=1 Tax=Marinivivus vitaminiproducens TaxID=3035935 RepID=UPI00279CF612|nr:hypothetical protein P4R82_05855 [Geminicoccaceae bacterium SCSIO 64248]